jgi:hypothetical protein
MDCCTDTRQEDLSSPITTVDEYPCVDQPVREVVSCTEYHPAMRHSCVKTLNFGTVKGSGIFRGDLFTGVP